MEPEVSPTAEHPIVTRIKSGDVPVAAKLTAARGLLPIPSEDLVGLLVWLLADSSEDVRKEAIKSLAEFPEEQLLPILSSDSCRSETLAHYARNPRNDRVGQALLLNPGTPDEAIEALASTITEPLLEILIRNEVRLIRHPVILDRIAANPHVSPAIRKRIEEIRTDFIDKVTIPLQAPAPITAPAPVEPEVAVPAAPEEEAEPDLAAPPTEALREILESEAVVDEAAAGEETELTLEQKIMKLSISEKIKLAHLGGRQSRMILIRDPNRTVSAAVLSGGKLSSQEVELIAQFRNIDDDLLRRISSMKQYMKSYNIVHNMVKNPRTPIGIVMRLMTRLQMSDLKRLENNNGVSGAVREQAKKMTRAARSAPH